MTLYGSVAGVEKLDYVITGKTFTAAQITIVEGLLDDAHGVIVGFSGSELTITSELTNIENMIVARWLWNGRNREQPPLDTLSTELRARLNIAREKPTSSGTRLIGSLHLR